MDARDQEIVTNKKPPCRDTFLGERSVKTNNKAPERNVIDVP